MTVSVANIQIKEYPKRTLAYVRNVGPYAGDTELFGRLFGKMSSWATANELMSKISEMITVYHDDPYSVPPEQQRISVGYTVPEGTVPSDDIELMELPAGKYLVGSFEILPSEYGDAWTEMGKYIQKESVPITSFCYESYRNEPDTHPEGKHLVDICMGVQ